MARRSRRKSMKPKRTKSGPRRKSRRRKSRKPKSRRRKSRRRKSRKPKSRRRKSRKFGMWPFDSDNSPADYSRHMADRYLSEEKSKKLPRVLQPDYMLPSDQILKRGASRAMSKSNKRKAQIYANQMRDARKSMRIDKRKEDEASDYSHNHTETGEDWNNLMLNRPLKKRGLNQSRSRSRSRSRSPSPVRRTRRSPSPVGRQPPAFLGEISGGGMKLKKRPVARRHSPNSLMSDLGQQLRGGIKLKKIPVARKHSPNSLMSDLGQQLRGVKLRKTQVQRRPKGNDYRSEWEQSLFDKIKGSRGGEEDYDYHEEYGEIDDADWD
jgi:hypothetical protein